MKHIDSQRNQAGSAAAKPNWKKLAARSFFFYALDMAVAIFGWIYGFGLEVKNLWALVGIMLFSRWVMHLMQNAWIYESMKDRIRQEGGAA